MEGDDPRESRMRCRFSHHVNLYLDVTGKLVTTVPGTLLFKKINLALIYYMSCVVRGAGRTKINKLPPAPRPTKSSKYSREIDMFKKLIHAMQARPCSHGGMHGTRNRERLALSARISRGRVREKVESQLSFKRSSVGVGW